MSMREYTSYYLSQFYRPMNFTINNDSIDNILSVFLPYPYGKRYHILLLLFLFVGLSNKKFA